MPEEQQQQQSFYGQQQHQLSSALQIRLDTAQIIGDIEKDLEGKMIIPEMDANGITKLVEKKTGNPRCNQEGRQAILSIVRSVINPQVVQGNFDEDLYHKYCFLLHNKLADIMFINRYKWEISMQDYSAIISMIMNVARGYISRLINNKERESYTDTVRHMEHSTIQSNEIQQRGKFLGIF